MHPFFLSNSGDGIMPTCADFFGIEKSLDYLVCNIGINYSMAKIMIIDDSADLLLLIGIIIKMEGHESISLTSPIELMQKIGEYNPDLIILDVWLGNYNGKEVCKNIKANPASKNIPVLLTSASAESLADFKDFDADDILEKPFELDTIKNKIKGLLIVHGS
jgi:DNA-binding response OmpR family regulator